MFRRKSLERLSSPDRLDQLLRVVKRRSWVPLLACAATLALVVVWSFVGRIPVSANGTAVLVHPRQVVPFQAPVQGQLVAIKVRVGDRVARGQLLATLNLPEIEKQLEQERAKLAQFRVRDSRMADFESAQAKREKKLLDDERVMLRARIARLKENATSTRERNRTYIAQQRENLATTRRLSLELGEALQARFESFQSLKSQGLTSDDAVVNARRALVENRLRLAELDVSERELALQAIESEESYALQMDRVADIEIEMHGLDLKEVGVNRRLLEASLSSTSREAEIQRTIARLGNVLETKGRVVAERPGRILEISASVGNFVAAGQRLGALEAEDPGRALVALAYFPVRDGKRLRSGMTARISPTTVTRARYGSIVGEVAVVSDYPVTTESAANQVGNRELAQLLVGGGNRIEVFASLQGDEETPSGLRWTSSRGPSLRITAGTTASVRVTIEERAPITFILPFLRSWIGG